MAAIRPGAERLPAPCAALIVLDGWGLAADGPGNAVSLAATPVFDSLWSSYPHTTLTTWGRAVGLPEGQMGNSEVGHLNLGAGAVVMQDLTRIDDAVSDGSLDRNEVLRSAFGGASRVHLIGLVSDGGVHSGFGHLRALISMAASLGVSELVVHAFTDGRDTLPHSGEGFVAAVEAWLLDAGVGRLGSVIGRYFAMDRDARWDRIQRAYDLLVHGHGEFSASSGAEAVSLAYERGETDEFISPTVVGEPSDMLIRPETDSVIAFNFRPDRMREITRALCDADLSADGFERGGGGVLQRYTTMTSYEEDWSYPVAFPPTRPSVTLSRVLADSGATQLHVAETEKYPHVTYFFNGGEEKPCAGERRELVPSPRDVATYDLKPAMSAPEAAEAFVSAWRADSPRFGIINFANADMVGHTGVIPAAVSAVEAVDGSLASVVSAVHDAGGACVITADHGNADNMLEPDGSPNTAHSLNPVPLIVTVPGVALRGQGVTDGSGGVLADVAPTVLGVLGISQPPGMTGHSLIS
ncbi:MAG TPA: 2,3-bisphosphoglycerate-independent phosphoglycerate mutase [Solirubrobacteraceae bacterium]|nr:2,3-bisphosphoglycerate-independent phosphoglycerate mutase [Solirubrobacteraceae bacterium]